MNKSKLLPALLIVGIALSTIGIYLIYSKKSSETVSETVGGYRFPDMSGSPGKPPSPSVKISADGKECLIVVPADARDGVKAIDKNGKEFVIHSGDQIELEISGKVQVGSDRAIVTAEGETSGYRDTGVDSPFYSNVGGLEFSIGSLSSNRFLAINNKQFTANYDGVPIFRIVDRLDGNLDGYNGNLGGFTVTIKKR